MPVGLPECIEQPASSLPPTLAVDPGVCVTVDLGVLSPGDVYDFSIIVVDDAIDVLFFDQNSIQPYELGQSYRSVMAQPASTESALGALEFTGRFALHCWKTVVHGAGQQRP